MDPFLLIGPLLLTQMKLSLKKGEPTVANNLQWLCNKPFKTPT